MKQIWLRNLLFIMLFIGVSVVLEAGSVIGSVTDAEGNALANSLIVLHGYCTPPQEVPPLAGDIHNLYAWEEITTTNAMGEFSFLDLRVGYYTVSATHTGYFDGIFGDETANLPTLLSIDTENQTVDCVDIILNRFVINGLGNAWMSGCVLDNNNHGLQGVYVGIATAANPDQFLPFQYACTDENGFYRIGGLIANQNYVTRAYRWGNHLALSENVAFTTNGNGESTDSVDIAVNTTGFDISGTIVEQNGMPARNYHVTLLSANDSLYTEIYTATDGNGHFQFNNISQGIYKVMAACGGDRVLYYPGVWQHDNAGSINLHANVTNANFGMPETQVFTLSGIVTELTSGAPLAGILVQAQHPLSSQDSTYIVYSATTDASGNYSLQIPYGEYTICAFDTSGNHQSQYFNSPNPLLAYAVLVSNDWELNLEMKALNATDAGSVSGHITRNGEIWAYPPTVVIASVNGNWINATLTDQNGFYTFEHLPAGQYYVFACSEGTPIVYYDGDLIWEEALPVTVNGALSNIDINLGYQGVSGSSVFSGTVMDSDGIAMPNVLIALQDEDNQTCACAFTNQQGMYLFSNLPNQSYNMIITRFRSITQESDVQVAGHTNMEIVLEPSLANEQDTSMPMQKVQMTTYPNPFNPETTIAFNLPKAAIVSVDIYNVKGQKVKSLLHEAVPAGRNLIRWNGKNDTNQAVASGCYFCRVKGKDFSQTAKMLLLK
jgi:flagellar hook assembly protein FlgD